MADDVFPDRDMSHRDKVLFMLEQNGWAIEVAGPVPNPEAPIPRYAYTIGFEDRFDFPEVCTFGLTPVTARGLFDLVAAVLAGGTRLPIGPVFSGLLDGGQRCAMLPVDVAAAVGMFPGLAEHRRAAGAPADSFRLVQLAWPDPGGSLPWEPGFLAELAPVQLLLGEPPA
jgi:hypothetical protein